MFAVRLHAFGGPEELRYEEVPDPEPGAGEVRVAVAAAGVHLVDTWLRAGRTPGPIPLPELPTVPGREVAGTVDRIGPGADPAWLGRRVVAHLGTAPGGYAELAVVPEARLHAVPDTLDLRAAVAMIGTGRTALAILRLAEIEPGDTVVVLAAAGGIGTLLVQHALSLGAAVVGAAGGPDKVAQVRALGAAAVDYRQPGWTDEVRAALGGERAATVVFDGVGGDAAAAALTLLVPGGRHLVYGWASGGPAEPVPGIDSRTLAGPALAKLTGTPEGLRALESAALSAAAEGTLVPGVQPFALQDAGAAHAALAARATTGKVVLTP
ncbi:zinc-binding dehydrogenase [Streptomyces sp. NRRL F-5123]|uniref:zinc-binding dehydrogenase n=1 Tax=Streptomyces sp. NRRL F-5123 TaxID=1463856 RepID=UPI0004E1709A|nr:zinc-binding dehydrogenase [Streptomyces sp. NRRL F-5123]